MSPKLSEYPDLDYTAITDHHYLYDLIYNPPKTLFLSKGEAQGCSIQNGLDMLYRRQKLRGKSGIPND
jgi:shikimate dehydrogenase